VPPRINPILQPRTAIIEVVCSAIPPPYGRRSNRRLQAAALSRERPATSYIDLR
jgi:hypothetical protein